MAETMTTPASWARPWRATDARRAWAAGLGSLDRDALDRLAAEEAAPPPAHDPLSYAGRCEAAVREVAVEAARRVRPWAWPLVRDAEAARTVWIRAFEREIHAGRSAEWGDPLPTHAHCAPETCQGREVEAADLLGAFAPGYYDRGD